MGTAGTLGNKKKSGFVRFPPHLAVLIGKTILDVPETAFAVCDPTCGEGDFFYATAHAPRARYVGVEISAERAAVCQQRWPSATIITSAVEAVVLRGTVQLLLTNGPFFLQNGKRAPYRIAVDQGAWLQAGGIHLSTFTARSDWDLRMINHWLTWYDRVQVWKFPNRSTPDDESSFEDYTQLLVAGIRRASPVLPSEGERKRLLGYQWKEPTKPGASGWRYATPPPELPQTPLAEPYRVPASREVPQLIVRTADEATLLAALDEAGAHLSAAWQQATTWSENGVVGAPAMPYTGEAHIAAEVMVGSLDGEIVWGPGSGPDAQPHLFTAFIGKEWVPMPVEEELQEKLRESGCIRVEMKQLMDKPILGVLNLQTGRVRYFQSEEVFDFLHPWIPTLASRVIAKRKPLYRLDPADWEVRVLSQFGTDKRLPNAPHAGLAVAQLHRVFAMGRSLDVKGRTAIQGEPGTGKTRMATGAAKRQAYRWRHRSGEFRHTIQPAWVRGLRRAWVKNPLTRSLLGLEPVYGRRSRGQIVVDAASRQIVAYREVATGALIAPEDAGPRALPVLVTTPLKVTKEYGKEIRAAFPHAEVVHLESYRAIAEWLQRCATSQAPLVVGIVSHSQSRAFGLEWREVVRERRERQRVPVLNPPDDLKPLLEPVRETRGRKQRIVGYRFPESQELLTEEVDVSFFSCPDCWGRIDAFPGKLDQPDEEEGQKKKRKGKEGSEEESSAASSQDRAVAVTSRTWFTIKPRWCTCAASARSSDRRGQGKPPLRTALWQEDRTKATNKKHPQISFAQWTQAFAVVRQQAEHAATTASTRELVERVRRDDVLLVRLVQAALTQTEACAFVCDLVERIDKAVTPLRRAVAETTETLAALLHELAARDEALLALLTQDAAFARVLVELAVRDHRSLMNVVSGGKDSGEEEEIIRLATRIRETEAQLADHLIQAARRDASHYVQERLVQATRALVDWQAVYFCQTYEQAHAMTAAHKNKPAGSVHGVRLSEAPGGPIVVEEIDREAARGYDALRDGRGAVIAYQLGHQGKVLVPLFGVRSKRVVGYVDASTGKVVTKQTGYDFRLPPADSFSPYEYLYQFFRGCVALSIVDESHNGRGRRTDIAHAHHHAMLAAQTHALTSGTHYGGDIIGFYHYWFRYYPQFWLSRGYGWNDAEKALSDYGVIQEWLKEYARESDARRGSGTTDVYVSTVPAPGLSANLIPGLLEDLTYLTVLDVGAHMPPKQEVPKGIPMKDPLLEAKRKEADHHHQEARKAVEERRSARTALLKTPDGPVRALQLAHLDERLTVAEQQRSQAQQQQATVERWIAERDLAGAYDCLVKELEELAAEGNSAARLALGTVPRWFAALPCESPFRVYASERGLWGDKTGSQLIVETPVLARDYLYPLERWMKAAVEEELAEGRRVMVYFEQVTRSMAQRLLWVLGPVNPWVLPANVEAEDRQQAIIAAVERGHRVVIVPYLKVNEGLNLQSVIDTILWAEMPKNLFLWIQASQRAWRLGKRELVKILIPYYIGSAAHRKVRQLGERDGAASAFAGEPAKGGLVQHVGADQTTLARLSAQIEQGELAAFAPLANTSDDSAVIEATFARRNAELAEALRRGRQWFGLVDELPERLARCLAAQHPDVWATLPPMTYLPEVEAFALGTPVTIAVQLVVEDKGEAQEITLEPVPSTPPVVAAPAERGVGDEGGPAPQVMIAVAGSGARLVTFGDEDDIRRVRKQRKTSPGRTHPKPRNVTTVKDIPVFFEEVAPTRDPGEPALAMASIWDSAFNED